MIHRETETLIKNIGNPDPNFTPCIIPLVFVPLPKKKNITFFEIPIITAELK